jgi:hypothetical protein
MLVPIRACNHDVKAIFGLRNVFEQRHCGDGDDRYWRICGVRRHPCRVGKRAISRAWSFNFGATSLYSHFEITLC